MSDPPLPREPGGRLGTQALRVLLSTTLVAPLLPRTMASAIPTPFAIDQWIVVGLWSLATWRLIAVEVGQRNRLTRRALFRIVLSISIVVAGAVVVDGLVARRATGFYTPHVLADALAVMACLHGLSAILRRAGERRAARWPNAHDVRPDVADRAAAWQRRRRSLLPSAEPHVSDRIDGIAAGCVVGFWLLVAAGTRELAGVMLLVAGMLVAITIPLRFATAWTASGASRRRTHRRHPYSS